MPHNTGWSRKNFTTVVELSFRKRGYFSRENPTWESKSPPEASVVFGKMEMFLRNLCESPPSFRLWWTRWWKFLTLIISKKILFFLFMLIRCRLEKGVIQVSFPIQKRQERHHFWENGSKWFKLSALKRKLAPLTGTNLWFGH